MARREGIQDETLVKYHAIFRRYNQILKEIGDNAPYVSKPRLWELTSKGFFLSPATIGTIVNRMLKGGFRYAELEDEKQQVDTDLEKIREIFNQIKR